MSLFRRGVVSAQYCDLSRDLEGGASVEFSLVADYLRDRFSLGDHQDRRKEKQTLDLVDSARNFL